MKSILIFVFAVNLICSICVGQQKVDITYIANSGFLIETGNKSIIIDGLFKQGWDTYLTPSDSLVSDIVNQKKPFENSNLMLITHNHGDHFDATMVVEYLLNNKENILIAAPNATNAVLQHSRYKEFGCRVVQLDKLHREKNDTTIRGIRVRSFFIQHDARPQIENVGYLIEMNDLKVFHTGDYNGSELEEFGKFELQNEQIDLAFCNFYGFWNTSEEREFTKNYLNPKQIVLTHIPPAEIGRVKDSVALINDFIDIAVYDSSMSMTTFEF